MDFPIRVGKQGVLTPFLGSGRLPCKERDGAAFCRLRGWNCKLEDVKVGHFLIDDIDFLAYRVYSNPFAIRKWQLIGLCVSILSVPSYQSFVLIAQEPEFVQFYATE